MDLALSKESNKNDSKVPGAPGANLVLLFLWSLCYLQSTLQILQSVL